MAVLTARRASSPAAKVPARKRGSACRQAVRANGSGQPPFGADLLVTGLVVGAGAKPLHD